MPDLPTSESEATNNKEQRSGRNRLSPVLWCLIVLGIVLRFSQLDRKDYWCDETLTLQHVSGYATNEILDRLIVSGKPFQFKELKPVQEYTPERGPQHVLHSIAHSQAEHSPLFYLIAHFWASAFGCEKGSMRCLPALLSLLQLPCIYWFMIELFAAPVAAELAVALVALSPLQLLYAQELREYSLFAAIVPFTSAAFLKAIEKSSWQTWLLYLFSLVLGFYVSILTVFILASQLLYLLCHFGLKWNKTISSFLLISLITLVCFLPWLAVIAVNAREAYASLRWLSVPVSLPVWINSWCDNVSKVFVELGPDYFQLSNVLSAVVLLLEAYAVYKILRRGTNERSFLIATLLLVPAIALSTLDLILGGQRSLQIKYVMSVPIAILLSLSYLLYIEQNGPIAARWFWRGLTCFIFACEIASCLIIVQAKVWPTKIVRNQDVVRVARIVNNDRQAVMVSEDGVLLDQQTNFPQILVLSHLVRPDLYLEFSSRPKLPVLLPGFKHYYLFNPSQEALNLYTTHGFNISQVDNLSYLYLATLKREGK